MLRVVVFGVACELDEEDDERFRVRDHFSLMGQKLWNELKVAVFKACILITRAKPEMSFSVYQPPRYERWWQAQRRRRKKPVHIGFTEFADLSDGRRVIVRSDRGFGWNRKRSQSPFHSRMTRESFADEIRDYFVQYEEERPTPPEWIVEHLDSSYGTEIDPLSVYAAMRVPLRVEFGPRIQQFLPQ